MKITIEKEDGSKVTVEGTEEFCKDEIQKLLGINQINILYPVAPAPIYPSPYGPTYPGEGYPYKIWWTTSDNTFDDGHVDYTALGQLGLRGLSYKIGNRQ